MSRPKRPGRTYRIILDTNWYISASLSQRSRQTLRRVLSDRRFIVYICPELVSEYNTVISRARFRKYISLPTVNRFRDLLLRRTEYITIEAFTAVNRDPKDAYLLDLTREVSANYLITGDPDLLTVKTFGPTTILTMRAFLTRFRILKSEP